MNLEGKIINVLGDSITQGTGTSAPEHIYQNILGRMVGAAEVRNYGVGGTRFARETGPDAWPAPFVDRYLDMDDDADLVLVFGATNDYWCGTAPFGELSDRADTTFCGACHTLFSGLAEKYPSARIVILTPLQRLGRDTPSPTSGHLLIDYVDTIIRIAAEYSLPVLDLYRTAGICPDIPIHQQLYAPDGLHPSDAGAYRIAERIAGFLAAL